MSRTKAAPEVRARRRRRWRIALAIAVVEDVAVAFSSGVSRFAVIVLAVAALALYANVGRRTRSRIGHDTMWVFAFSQSLAVIGAVLSFFFSWLAYAVAALLAVAGLVLLALDR
jgi:hypothetical protein